MVQIETPALCVDEKHIDPKCDTILHSMVTDLAKRLIMEYREELKRMMSLTTTFIRDDVEYLEARKKLRTLQMYLTAYAERNATTSPVNSRNPKDQYISLLQAENAILEWRVYFGITKKGNSLSYGNRVLVDLTKDEPARKKQCL